MMVAVDRKVDRKEERHPVPHPNQKEITYLEVANVQFSHLLGVHQLAVITNIGASVVFVHVIRQRAAIQQGPRLAAQAYHERFARDLLNSNFRRHQTRRGGGRGGRRGRGRGRDTLKRRGGCRSILVMLPDKGMQALLYYYWYTLPSSACLVVNAPSH